MINFERAKQDAYTGIKQTNSIEKIDPSSNARLGFKHNYELWKIGTEILINGSIKEFKLLVGVKADFPLSLPNIYLSQEDFDSIKYIPHVDEDRKICLFDQENIKIDSERPLEILKVCLNRAVKVIEDGVSKSNQNDFSDEIIAYWANTYHDKDNVVGAYVGEGVEKAMPGRIIVNYLNPSYNKVNVLWLAAESLSGKILAFFKERGHRVEEVEAFYLGSIPHLTPPFYFTNESFIDFIKEHFSLIWPDVKRYLNRDFGSKIFVFSSEVNGEMIYFGFYFYAFKTKFNGWRAKSLTTVQILSNIESRQAVNRLIFTEFSSDRLKKRTDGLLAGEQPYKFVIAGLGSIGSNLIPYLNALEVSDFKLIDPEILKLENVNRHLLTYNDVGLSKVDGIAKYLLANNPFLNITKHSISVINLIQKGFDELNNFDVIFCAIGKDSIEAYILQCLSEGKINKPIIFLWVEPYLLGAHLLYINPQTGFKLKDMEIDGFYKYNVIANDTYKSEQSMLLLKEAGCQGSYIPYGKEGIVQFFAAIVPKLYTIIRSRASTNFALTYIGDLELADKLGLDVAKFVKQNNIGNLIKHDI